MIQIDTSSVTGELRNHPDFIWIVQSSSDFFNSARFDKKERAIICLHEGTHLFYCRKLGFEPRLYGPSVIFDEVSVKFRRLDSAVQGLPHEIKMSAEPLLVAKQFMAPFYTEQKLISGRTIEQMWKDCLGDLRNFNDWATQRQRLLGDVKGIVSMDEVRDSVFKDLRSPAFCRKIWDTAHEFEARVFGKPN